VLGTAAFGLGIAVGHLPMGSAVALFMVPILAVCATLILRRIVKRGSDA
jgi:multiple sugar transport system permease protein